MAASALSAVLTNHHVEHAFIGGFAVQIIGSLRRTEDIDVQIDLTDGTSREQVVQHLLAADSRFSVRDTKLSFTPAEAPEYSVPIETLPVGSLGLPPALDIIRLGDGTFPLCIFHVQDRDLR